MQNNTYYTAAITDIANAFKAEIESVTIELAKKDKQLLEVQERIQSIERSIQELSIAFITGIPYK